MGGGNPTYWTTESAGHGGALLHTLATDAAAVDNFGIWTVNVEHPGTYELEVYADASIAESQMARYRVSHAHGEKEVVVDQSAVDGWQSLGTFPLDGSATVRLDDITGEALSLERRLVFDALRITGLDVEVPGGVGGGAGSGAGSSGGGGEATGAGASTSAPAAAPNLAPSKSCSCGVVGHGHPSGGLLGLLALGLIRVRRRRHDKS